MQSRQAITPSHSLVFLTALSLVTGFFNPSARAATACFTDNCAMECTPADPVSISTLVPNSEFPAGADSPIGFVDPDDDGDLRFIPTKQGAILAWQSSTRTILPSFFLDLRDNTGGPVDDSASERGLLAMVMDPDYAENGRFYVFYSRKNEGNGTRGDIVIERYQRSAADPNIADPSTATRILVINHSSASNHNGGFMAFGPDGFLYISTGDGGGGCDGGIGISGDGQSSDTLAGKMLRIDVRGIDPQAGAPDDCMEAGTISNYTVPSSNPFFGDESACDEVWTLGLRNPFRFSFDRTTGDLYIGDVGQRKWEEINLLAASTPAPANFGWVCREGCETANNNESSCSTAGCPIDTGSSCEFPRSKGNFWDPMLCHYNGDWKSIMGGYRYRGANVPSMEGDYIYADASCGQIWKTTSLDPADPASVDAECWASKNDSELRFQGVFGFAEDHLGELYIIVGEPARIDCIHNGNGCPWVSLEIFEDGFEQAINKRQNASSGLPE